MFKLNSAHEWVNMPLVGCSTGELVYDGPLYNRFLHMTDDMLGPSPMQVFIICI